MMFLSFLLKEFNMDSISTYTNKILTKMSTVVQNEPYFSSVLSSIEQYSKVKFNINDKIIMSTAEHFGVYNHYKTFSNTFTISYEAHKKYKDINTYFIILADSLIPLDNADYPRGIISNIGKDKLRKTPLFTKKHIKSFPYYLNNSKIPIKDFDIIDDSFGQAEVLSDIKRLLDSGKDYFNRIFDANSYLYNKILSNVNGKPRLIYLSLEQVAITVLIHMLENDDTFCNDFILNNHLRTYNYLYGVRTCWGENNGSFLFWHNDNGKLRSCKLRNNTIYSDTKVFELTKTSIVDNLHNGLLLPGGFLSLAVVTILPNFPTIGGVPQKIFLGKMIEYINNYSSVIINPNINNSNWGIHPDISKYLPKSPQLTTAIYLAANPPSTNQLDNYFTNETILI